MSTERTGISSETLTLTLDKLASEYSPNINIHKAVCVFSYIWNWESNTGSATLLTMDGVQIDGAQINLELFGFKEDSGEVRFVGVLSGHSDKVTLPAGSPFIDIGVELKFVGDTKMAGVLFVTEPPRDGPVLLTQNWQGDKPTI